MSIRGNGKIILKWIVIDWGLGWIDLANDRADGGFGIKPSYSLKFGQCFY